MNVVNVTICNSLDSFVVDIIISESLKCNICRAHQHVKKKERKYFNCCSWLRFIYMICTHRYVLQDNIPLI